MGTNSSSLTTMIMLNATRFLAAAVFLGWVFLFAMMSTNTFWLVWMPKVWTNTYSTYFGAQGSNMLLITFPLLFIAVVGCIHLHISKKSNFKSKLNNRLEILKKPFIVQGPLGIISVIEFIFCLMFLALVLWAMAMHFKNNFAPITKESAKASGHKVWQEKLQTAGLNFAYVGYVCFALLFLPVTRMSSLLPLLGLTSESSIRYHVWIGHIVMALFTTHGLCYIIFWISLQQVSQMIKWTTDGVSNLAGEIALASGLLMWVTTFPSIRRRMFELFFYTHQLYIVFLVFFLLHVGMKTYCYVLPGIYLFAIDRCLRFLQSRRKVRLVSARLLPSEAVELNFSKIPGFSYTPLSTVFINVPSLSSFQWHPFTITSSSNLEPEKLSIVIKKEGRWTQKLYEKLNQISLERLNVSVEGPYGPESVNFLKHDSLVLISGGSGITPFIAIIRELLHHATNLKTPTPKVLLISCFKTSNDLTMLDLLLPITSNFPDLSKVQLNIKAFVTREKSPTENTGKSIRTIWFKHDSSDSPISPILGPNSWLWLAAIIASSFVSYLVLLGILTRYYIYPIEMKGKKYSLTSSALLNLMFICVCIAVSCSAAVLWNKKLSKMEDKQVQSFSGDCELESLPHESLESVRTVSFGTRPDLKEMLLEMEGSSVGVMASGPRTLRRQVASICSSSEADNLHFESISFTW